MQEEKGKKDSKRKENVKEWQEYVLNVTADMDKELLKKMTH